MAGKTRRRTLPGGLRHTAIPKLVKVLEHGNPPRVIRTNRRSPSPVIAATLDAVAKSGYDRSPI
jgi:hypothetical protein